MKEIFLYVPQGYINRWQYNDSNKQYGLFTDGFYNCAIVLLKGKANGRIVMMHVDPSVVLDDVKRELEWAGQDCQKVIYIKDNDDARETIDDLFGKNKIPKDFETKIISKQYFNGKIVPDTTRPLLPDGVPVPEYESDAIWFNSQNISATKDYLPAVTVITDAKQVEMVYQKQQLFAKETKPKKGTGSIDLNMAMQALLDNTFAQWRTELIKKQQEKTYWLFCTKNNKADGTNIMQNLFISTPQDKHPQKNINCFSKKSDAEQQLKKIFKDTPVSKGGYKKAFIFEAHLLIDSFVSVFSAKERNVAAAKLASFVEYTYDRDKDLLKELSENLVPNTNANNKQGFGL